MQDNIVFGKAYEEQWYVRVVTACALTDDLAMLPWGDLTEIGERGVNLSGQLLVTYLLCLSCGQQIHCGHACCVSCFLSAAVERQSI